MEYTIIFLWRLEPSIKLLNVSLGSFLKWKFSTDDNLRK